MNKKFNSQKLTGNRNHRETHVTGAWSLGDISSIRQARELVISQRKMENGKNETKRCKTHVEHGLHLSFGSSEEQGAIQLLFQIWFAMLIWRRKSRRGEEGEGEKCGKHIWHSFPPQTLSHSFAYCTGVSFSRWERFMCGRSNKIIASDFLCKSLFAPRLTHGQNENKIVNWVCIWKRPNPNSKTNEKEKKN